LEQVYAIWSTGKKGFLSELSELRDALDPGEFKSLSHNPER
jgi:hypothetical protein